MKKDKLRELYKLFKESDGVSIDSRTIGNNQLFFALKGPNFDGHTYVDSVLENGVNIAIIDDPKYLREEKTFLVPNSEKALQALATYHRDQLNIPIIGLTGSNGKTTTKELIASALNEKYEVFATKGNLNNHLGVPLSLLSINKNHDVAIIEMGANHPKEIAFLSNISKPNIGLITNIGKAHLEGFGNIEGVRKAKTELYEFILSTNGIIFINIDDDNLKKSITPDYDAKSYSLEEIEVLQGFPHIELIYNETLFHSSLSGRYNATNILAAIKISEHFGLSLSQISDGIKKYTPNNNRSQIKKTQSNTLILDAYNANPSSMKASIENLASAQAEKKVLIIGHMLELGPTSKSEHSELVEFISRYEWADVLLVGNEFAAIDSKDFKIFESTTTLSEYLIHNKIKDSTVLLKGSRGIALEKVIEYL